MKPGETSNHLEKKECNLSAEGFTYTLNGVYDWAGNVVAEIRKCVGESQAKAWLWSYRHNSNEILALDFACDEAGRDYSITFITGLPHDHNFLNEPCVPDMAEAIHMAGLVIGAMNASVQVGRRSNECNEYCTPETWAVGQTNGSLVLP